MELQKESQIKQEGIDFDPSNPETVKLIAHALGAAARESVIRGVFDGANRFLGKSNAVERFKDAVLDKLEVFFPVQKGTFGGKIENKDKPTAEEILQKIIFEYQSQNNRK